MRATSFRSWLRHRASYRSWGVVLIIVAGLLPLSGCGQDDSYGDRVPLSGTVTAKGKPLDIPATIYFVPAKGEGGVGSSGEVADSKFTIPEESGPTPGKTYNVSLTTVPGIPPEGTPRDQIRLPEHYETTLTIPARGEESEDLTINFE